MNDFPYRDRHHAGRVLAGLLQHLRGRPRLLVLALPRGGVAVGFEVAQALGAPLDVFVVRKLGYPGHEEYAMGAIATGGVQVLNPETESVPAEVVAAVAARERLELERREHLYRGEHPAPYFMRFRGSEKPPRSVWEVAQQSGLTDMVHPNLMFDIGYFYSELDGIGDRFVRYSEFVESQVLPRRDQPEQFYDAQGKLKPEFGQNMERLREWASDAMVTVNSADCLIKRFDTPKAPGPSCRPDYGDFVGKENEPLSCPARASRWRTRPGRPSGSGSPCRLWAGSAATKILVNNGRTIVLGGLSDRQHEVTRAGVPFLSSLPWVGGLFGRSDKTRTETELFLFLTPHVIRADADADKLTAIYSDSAKKVRP